MLYMCARVKSGQWCLVNKDAVSVTQPIKQRFFFENVVGRVTARGEFGILYRAVRRQL